jgi:hypothetical protein
MHGCTKVQVKATALAFSILVGCVSALFFAGPATTQPARGKVTYLNQAWSPEDRDGYYRFSQCSTVICYDIIVNLEVVGGQQLFRGDADSERYGLGSRLSGSVG